MFSGGFGVGFLKLLESESGVGFFKTAGVGVGSQSRFFKTAGVGVGSRFIKTAGVGVVFLKLLESESVF